jgi:hypothetical protein
MTRFLYLAFSLLAITAASCTSSGHRVADRIVALSKDSGFTSTDSLPWRIEISNRDREALISLAGEKTSDLQEAFTELDQRRAAASPQGFIDNDAVYRAGELIMILAFNEDRVKINREKWWQFKGSFIPDSNLDLFLKSKPDLSSWPWKKENDVWSLATFDIPTSGFTSGKLLPLWYRLVGTFQRRELANPTRPPD